MDKNWLNIKNRCDIRYIEGIDDFLDWAYSQPNMSIMIRWPCKGHLQGEVLVRVENSNVTNNDEVKDENVEEDNIPEMIHDVFGYMNKEDMNSLSRDNEEPNVHARKFYKLVEDVETEIYPGCKKVSNNKSVDALLIFFNEILLEGSFVPNSFYEAKKVLRDLGLGYNKINAHENDSILYWHEYANAESCHKCSKPRWNTEILYGKRDNKEDEMAQRGCNDLAGCFKN
ncbi:hypothetical protein A4A49_52953 [Nicotiana attenuata]|uniref:Transposase-associated domain-containing protein n=1 Tax=Nicotiana attenuata TaxID=49451 RepID=A0A314KMY8_NICAT|nr:hypothetical protein A4A49_52953 [Nicotiana attenuata]